MNQSHAPALALALALALAALLACAANAHALDLSVEVLNARSAEGNINAAVHATEAGWLKESESAQAQRLPAAGNNKTVLVFRNLAPGRYAVSLFHDENRNGKLDTNVVGMPTERYGFSRNATGRMGPPAFADAAVELQADTVITVNLR